MKENFKRFDIILVDFGQVEFAGEQGGKRPAVILQNDVGNHYLKNQTFKSTYTSSF